MSGIYTADRYRIARATEAIFRVTIAKVHHGVALGIGRRIFIVSWHPKWSLRRYFLPSV